MAHVCRLSLYLFQMTKAHKLAQANNKANLKELLTLTGFVANFVSVYFLMAVHKYLDSQSEAMVHHETDYFHDIESCSQSEGWKDVRIHV